MLRCDDDGDFMINVLQMTGYLDKRCLVAIWYYVWSHTGSLSLYISHIDGLDNIVDILPYDMMWYLKRYTTLGTHAIRLYSQRAGFWYSTRLGDYSRIVICDSDKGLVGFDLQEEIRATSRLYAVCCCIFGHLICADRETR
jgi:hypothetical protein